MFFLAFGGGAVRRNQPAHYSGDVVLVFFCFFELFLLPSARILLESPAEPAGDHPLLAAVAFFVVTALTRDVVKQSVSSQNLQVRACDLCNHVSIRDKHDGNLKWGGAVVCT